MHHSDKSVSVQVSGGVATVMMNRSPVNALNKDLVIALTETMTRAASDRTVRAIVLASELHVFCAGADLKMAQMFDGWDMGAWTYALQRALDTIEALRVPTIAAIGGAALGGGLELALACDIRIASRSARVGLPEARRGILPGAGATQRLKRCMTYARALEFMLAGREVDATTALELGIVSQVVDDPVGAALSLARSFSGVSSHSVSEIKAAMLAGENLGFAAGSLRESTGAARLVETAEYAAGVGTFGR